jgi:hypothetical protein
MRLLSLVFAFSLFAFSASASATLTVEVHPPAVTTGNSAAIMMEASSSHISIAVFYPEDLAGGGRTRVEVFSMFPLAPGEAFPEAAWPATITEGAALSLSGPADLIVAIARDGTVRRTKLEAGQGAG